MRTKEKIATTGWSLLLAHASMYDIVRKLRNKYQIEIFHQFWKIDAKSLRICNMHAVDSFTIK